MQEWRADGEGVQVAAEGEEEWEEAEVVTKASLQLEGRARFPRPGIAFVLNVGCRYRTNWGGPVPTQSAPSVGQE